MSSRLNVDVFECRCCSAVRLGGGGLGSLSFAIAIEYNCVASRVVLRLGTGPLRLALALSAAS